MWPLKVIAESEANLELEDSVCECKAARKSVVWIPDTTSPYAAAEEHRIQLGESSLTM